MGQDQWLEVRIAALGADITLREVTLKHGRLFDPRDGSRGRRLRAAELDGATIRDGSTLRLGACGNDDVSFGAEGSVVLYLNDLRLGVYYWDCAERHSPNRSVWTAHSPYCQAKLTGGHVHGHALGLIRLQCRITTPGRGISTPGVARSLF